MHIVGETHVIIGLCPKGSSHGTDAREMSRDGGPWLPMAGGIHSLSPVIRVASLKAGCFVFTCSLLTLKQSCWAVNTVRLAMLM